MSLPAFLPHRHLVAHATLVASVALLSSALSLHSRLLDGLHTYIHPENLGNGDGGLRAAIRRPGSETSPSDLQQRRRTRSKDGVGVGGKFEFGESNAQLFRLRLVDSHLRTRNYFPEYRAAFISTAVALSSLLLGRFLPLEDLDSDSSAAAAVPVLSSLFAAFYLLFALAKLSFERSATKRSEKQLAALSCFLGFLVAVLIMFVLSPSVFDFRFGDESDGLSRVVAAALAGCLAGFLLVPATRAARSLWLGTDQLRWNLVVISCGSLSRVLLYAAFLASISAPLLWIKPVAEVRARTVRHEKFSDFRVWYLVGSTALQVVVLRPNLQMYLNEAVLSWYQRLHASKVPDLDFGRAKIFLHNYYLCLVVLQFFAPAALVLLFLGLSQMRGNLFSGILFIGGFTDCSSAVKETALFLGWWIAFVWAIFATSTLVLLRCGFLFIS